MTIHPVPKPKPRKKRAPKPMKRSRMKCRGPRTKKSGGRLFYKDREPLLEAAIHTLPCCFCLVDCEVQEYPTEVEHLKTRGSSGRDRDNTVPTCQTHRQMRDAIGPETMWARYKRKGLDVWALAKRLTMQFDEGKLAA